MNALHTPSIRRLSLALATAVLIACIVPAAISQNNTARPTIPTLQRPR
jgi:hypothetical protein